MCGQPTPGTRHHSQAIGRDYRDDRPIPRKRARYREFPAHPQFAKARSDFERRWACDYGEYGDRVYLQALSRMGKRFLTAYRLLRDRTGNDPSAVARAREMFTELDHTMDELWQIYGTVHDRRRGFSLLMGQVPWEFRVTVAAVEQRWASILQKVHSNLLCDGILEERPRTRHAAGALDHKWLDDLLESLPPAQEEPPDNDDDWWRFDERLHSIASIINELEEKGLSSGSEFTNDWEGWVAGALKWLQDTAGLDFSELQKRWKEVAQLIPVPDHVAEKEQRAGPRGLFRYLNQIRLAYITRADLPALALCRSTTELLIRRHYASDVADPDDSINNPLIPLIKKLQGRLRDPSRVIKYVTVANDILHSHPVLDGNGHDPEPDRQLVRDWVTLLKDMIDHVPEALPGAPEMSSSLISRLTHMIEAIQRIRSETTGVSMEAFEADWRKRWLVERGLLMISEASRHLSEEIKSRHSTIPWRDVIGLRRTVLSGAVLPSARRISARFAPVAVRVASRYCNARRLRGRP